MSKITTDPEIAVQNGIAFFEAGYQGWEEKLSYFNVSSADNCPLSLVTGMDFYDWIVANNKDMNWARHHGFYPHTPFFRCQDLQKAWENALDVIKSRI